MLKEMNSPISRQELLGLLQAHGVSPTLQRVEIAQVLFAKPQHLTAEQVLAEVNLQGNLVSKATIYNTLGLFAKNGLLREIFVEPTKVVYDSNTSPHQHFYNVDSGLLTDISSSQLNIDKLPAAPEGMQLDGVDVIIRIKKTDQ